jgi:hypothetical protein
MAVTDGGEKAGIKKVKFTEAEDLRLLELIRCFGCMDWQAIAAEMRNRSVRQCRERWYHYLSPFVSHNAWTSEEEQLLREKVAECGKKWTHISRFFPSRTAIHLKNHWTVMDRQRRNSSAKPNRPVADFHLLDEVIDREEALWNELGADWLECARPGALAMD